MIEQNSRHKAVQLLKETIKFNKELISREHSFAFDFSVMVIWTLIEATLLWIIALFHSVSFLCLFGLLMLFAYFSMFNYCTRRIIEDIKNLQSASTKQKQEYRKVVDKQFALIGLVGVSANIFCGWVQRLVHDILETPTNNSFTWIILAALPLILGTLSLRDAKNPEKLGTFAGKGVQFLTGEACIKVFYLMLSGLFGGSTFLATEDIFRIPTSLDNWWIFSSYRTDAAATLAILYSNFWFTLLWKRIPEFLLCVTCIRFVLDTLNNTFIKNNFLQQGLVIPRGYAWGKVIVQGTIIYMAICGLLHVNLVEYNFTRYVNPLEGQTFGIEQKLSQCLDHKGDVACYKQAAMIWQSTCNRLETEVLSNAKTELQKQNFHIEKAEADKAKNFRLALLKKETASRPDHEKILLSETIRLEKRRAKDVYYHWLFNQYQK